jgi:hypothetical protein
MSQFLRRLTHGATVLSTVVLAVAAVTPVYASPGRGAERPAQRSAATPNVAPVVPSISSSDARKQARVATPPVDAATSCKQVRSRLKTYAQQGLNTLTCVDVGSPVTVGAGTSSLVRPEAAPAVWCDNQKAGTWVYNRTQACVHDIPLTVESVDAKTGATLGTAFLTSTQQIDLNPKSTSWLEAVWVTYVSSTGALTGAPIQISFDSSCTSPCTSSGPAWPGAETIVQGQTVNGSFDYTDQPGLSWNNLTITYTMTMAILSQDPIKPISSWLGPARIRCDNVIGNVAGCVFPDAEPMLNVSLGTYGASAAMIWWAQHYLPDKWGLYGSGQPLTRLADPILQKANRKAICEDGTWVSDGGDDSCDEYAFAATQQSGGRLGLTGAKCAEVRPFLDNNGNWNIAQLRYNGTERCVRGHVPLRANTDVGSALGNFTLDQRVMDEDKYWVQVVS